MGCFLASGSITFSQGFEKNFESVISPRCRVIIDNDFGGDPDGLFQLAHHLLSPTVEVKAIIGSITYPDGFYGYPGTPEHSTQMARSLLQVMKLNGKYEVLSGASERLKDVQTPVATPAAKAIVTEAMRTDTDLPLYVVCGAGLTNMASALLLEPKIADKLTMIWIGGTEYDGLATPPPGAGYHWEYNTGIDPVAAQVVFNHSSVNIWQVPRNAYRQALYSYSELLTRVKNNGATGKYLVERLEDLWKRSERKLGEAYVLGDSPLVLLTALQSSWEVDPSSSKYVLRYAPRVSESGFFTAQTSGRQIRVYDQIDTRLMFEDFVAKLTLFHQSR